MKCIQAAVLALGWLSATNLLAQALPDTDKDGWPDTFEAARGSNPNDAASVPKSAGWVAEVTKSAPKYWWRFEETDVAAPTPNKGSLAGTFDGLYGPEILNSDLGKDSAAPGLGKALEFTGPQAGTGTQKYVDFGDNIAELIDSRSDPQDKTTTVEYWIKTTQTGGAGLQTWNSPSILGHESGGDGDMYWGWLSDSDFGFSTSDITEIYANRDGKIRVSNGQWHHIVLIKEWHQTSNCVSRMYIDGGSLQAGVTITRNTGAGNVSFQDDDGGIRFLGFTQAGGSGSLQYIGLIDEVAIYDHSLSESEIRLHYLATVVDSDGDGLPDNYEVANGLNPNSNDSAADPDGDGLSNLEEFKKGTNPKVADTDGDGLSDGVETGTGIWVGATNTGTDALKADTDGDGLKDGAETNTGIWVSATNTGTNPLIPDTDGDGLRDGVETNTGTLAGVNNTGTSPLKKDSDADGIDDASEIALGTDPTKASSVPPAGTWAQAIARSAPRYWYRFEGADLAQGVTNAGSVAGFAGTFGAEIQPADIGKPSAFPALGKAMEFTGDPAGNGTQKYVDFGTPIPELINSRITPVDKTTSVEYWIKTTQTGSAANQTWLSPSLLARESGGDGDMYWGWFNANGALAFSTSDLVEIFSDTSGYPVNNDQWHHIVLVKEWHTNALCRSTMYIDGGTLQGGVTLRATTPAGAASYQDDDGAIQFLGFTQNGGGADLQYIGQVDEVAIYNRALGESEVKLHYLAALPDTDGDGIPDTYETANGLNPNTNDADQDLDNDGLSNLAEFRTGTKPNNADTDGDGLKDGAETNTGVWVSATNAGTNPLNADTDGDGLKDGTETNTGTFVTATNAGSDPLKPDTDGDGYKDGDEVALGSDPTKSSSNPAVPKDWVTAIKADAPAYWWRFEGSDLATAVPNEGSVAGFAANFLNMTPDELGKASASTNLGKALEFTGPPSGVATPKALDFGAPIPELVNFRSAPEEKTTTVEYWIKTTHAGTSGDQTWNSPSILGHESPGDGDMYWGWFEGSGRVGFSTSDIREIYAPGLVDDKWHHIVMVKEWHWTNACISTMYVDGGGAAGGKTYTTTTGAGAVSFQDDDSVIQYLGFTEGGASSDLQYIGLIDEVVIYNKALTEGQVRLHYLSAGVSQSATPGKFNVTTLSSGKVNLSWTGTGVLQETAKLAGAATVWTDVAGVTGNSTSITPTGLAKFYRLR